MSESQIAWPKKAREIQTRICDSTRWNGFKFRDDDIVVSTWGKTGTTWTMRIVSELIFRGHDSGGPLVQPWLDQRGLPLDPTLRALEAQTHRRLLKTHLPVSALVFSPRAKYINVGRDVRDVTWSLYNHTLKYTDEALARYNTPQDLGPPVERPRSDVRQFYLDFLDDPKTAHESVWPFWEHVQSWWDVRRLPNVLLVHYSNLKADTPRENRRIAQFLDIPADEALVGLINQHCSFDHMKSAALASSLHTHLTQIWQGGAETFFNKGTNGRWKDVLTQDEIELADKVAAQHLTPDCAHWLKTGELPEGED